MRNFLQLLINFLLSLQYSIIFHTLQTKHTIKCRSAKTWSNVPDGFKCMNVYHFILKIKHFLLNNS